MFELYLEAQKSKKGSICNALLPFFLNLFDNANGSIFGFDKPKCIFSRRLTR